MHRAVRRNRAINANHLARFQALKRLQTARGDGDVRRHVLGSRSTKTLPRAVPRKKKGEKNCEENSEWRVDADLNRIHLEEYYRMMKKHVRERRFNFLQWIADRGRPLDMEAMNALPWFAVDDPNDDCTSLDDDMLGRRAQAESAALFEEMRAQEENEDAAAVEEENQVVEEMLESDW
jgi:hypothetical protein